MTESQGPYDGERTNQGRDEPIPASHDDDRGGENSPLQHVQEAQPQAQEPDTAGPGQAVADMLPSGPAPQGDVPDAPAVQLAAAEQRGEDDQEERPGMVRIISNAVPGKPDGEVDTRS
ncbi:MAG TPA: hypothetical protein VGD68_01520 [Streptosporangiaceae bacterium]